MFKRPQFKLLRARLQEPRRFIHVLAGPRQTGKTTLARQVAEGLNCPVIFVSADEPRVHTVTWLEQQWDNARLQARKAGQRGALLVIDEAQKVADWSEVVKRLWDEDTASKARLKVLLLGSAPLLIKRGLTESLAGRFEIIPLSHWSFPEMFEAFGWTWEQFVYYGGYPGSATLIRKPTRWADYIKDSLIETTIARDILLMTRVDKPALLRQLFHLGCAYSGQILSYQKMLGQLQDAGNTVTLAHYLDLLSGSGMVTGLQKIAGEPVRQRSSSPKLLALNTALVTAQWAYRFNEMPHQPEVWGRLVESAVGAHLVNSAVGARTKVMYWREGVREVDFVVDSGRALTAIEVKTGRRRDDISGLDVLAKRFKLKRKLLVGTGGIPIREFLEAPLDEWVA